MRQCVPRAFTASVRPTSLYRSVPEYARRAQLTSALDGDPRIVVTWIGGRSTASLCRGLTEDCRKSSDAVE